MKKYLLLLFLTITSFSYSNDENLKLLISEEEIAAKISEVAQKINEDYRNKHLTIVMIMKGALSVTADLMRQIEIPFKLEYVKASSYGYNGTTSGVLTINGLENLEVEGRDILVVDDIFETGKTMLGVMDMIQTKNPSSLKTLLLLVKDVPRKTNYRPDYVLFDIEDHFVIGYGLDYKEFYRGLPAIYHFVNDAPPF